MNIEQVELEFSSCTPKQHREMIKVIRYMDYLVDISNYQDFHYFRFCEEREIFKFFEESNENYDYLNYKNFIKEFKYKAVKKILINEKDYLTIIKKYEDLGELIKKLKIK